MPFSYVGGIISAFVEIIRKGFMLSGELSSVPEAAVFRCVDAALKAGSCGAAYGLAGESIFKKSTFLCNFIKILLSPIVLDCICGMEDNMSPEILEIFFFFISENSNQNKIPLFA